MCVSALGSAPRPVWLEDATDVLGLEPRPLRLPSVPTSFPQGCGGVRSPSAPTSCPGSREEHEECSCQLFITLLKLSQQRGLEIQQQPFTGACIGPCSLPGPAALLAAMPWQLQTRQFHLGPFPLTLVARLTGSLRVLLELADLGQLFKITHWHRKGGTRGNEIFPHTA